MSIRRTRSWRPLAAARLGGATGPEVVSRDIAEALTTGSIAVEAGDVIFMVAASTAVGASTFTVSSGESVTVLVDQQRFGSTYLTAGWARIAATGSTAVSVNSGTYIHVAVLRGVSAGNPVLIDPMALDAIVVAGELTVDPFALSDSGVAIVIGASQDDSSLVATGTGWVCTTQNLGTSRSFFIAYQPVVGPGDTSELTLTQTNSPGDNQEARRLAFRGSGVSA